ncbi:MAG: CDP-alcohol phosphatidyltransferase [candidate division WS6 bacterium 34_10]|uniref:CDP-alcohol phosphatidyltransferase n=1 Tax=candidate division WS6 bacterium 34_10 TaxID=1641389 RepID=A0A101HIG9_9BACT|nr:MAG: CDP-alcohol phosphatidyltransferase [candidate division WS6 bacterium 34_10]
MKDKKDRTFKRLKDVLDEEKWEEFIDNIEDRVEEILGREVEIDLSNLRIEYKRDEQDAVNTAITANAEEKAKEYICPRIPEWMSPDHLTVIGVIGILISAIGYILGFFNRVWLLLVPLGLVINWFGDSFDGSIARYRKRTRPNYGYYIDKIVDSVVIIMFALGIGLSGFVKIEIALLLAVMYLAMMMHVDLVVHVQNKAQNSFGMFGPTEIRIIGILFTAIMYFVPVTYYNIYGHYLTQYDFGVFGISVIMFFVLIVSIFRKGIELHKQDIKNWK